MDSETSLSSLFVWVLVAQGIILGLVGLMIVYHRVRRSSPSTIPTGDKSHVSFHRGWIVGGGLMMAVAMAAFAYEFFFPKEAPWYEDSHPRTKPDVRQMSAGGPEDEGSPDQPSPYAFSPEDIRARTGGGSSVVRDAFRKSLRGNHPDERKGLQPPDPVLHTYLSLIQRWQRESGGPSSDADFLSPKSVYDRLTTQYGFKGDQSVIEAYLSQGSPVIPESCGKAAEVDWIPVTLGLQGTEVQAMCLCMTSSWSGRYAVFCCRCDHITSFLEAHMRVFDVFGGVFPRLIYRALSNRMADRLEDEASPQRSLFERFRGFYSVAPDFSRMDGGVDLAARERQIRNLLSQQIQTNDRWKDLDQLNRILPDRSKTWTKDHAGKEIQQVYRQEALCLLPFPKTRFDNVLRVRAVVEASDVIQVEGARYAVPKGYAGRTVEVALSCDRVDIFDGAAKIASHARLCRGNRPGETTD